MSMHAYANKVFNMPNELDQISNTAIKLLNEALELQEQGSTITLVSAVTDFVFLHPHYKKAEYICLNCGKGCELKITPYNLKEAQDSIYYSKCCDVRALGR